MKELSLFKKQARIVLPSLSINIFKISDPETFRNKLFLFWDSIDVLGRIYVAHEGINAQLSVPADHFETFKSHLDFD